MCFPSTARCSMMVNAALLLHGNRAMEEFRPHEKRRQNATICVTLIACRVAGFSATLRLVEMSFF